MEPIYLDHAATTPVHPEVTKAMLPVLQEVFGNPSSVHHFGRKARQVIDEARRVIAGSIHANEKEIVFTSGGTEADNLAVVGTALANQKRGMHVITTQIEHHATLHASEYLEKLGFEITYLPVGPEGKVSVDELESALREDTILVSIMAVNNETGMIQPIKEIGGVLKDHPAYFHSDAVQAYGLLDINVDEWNVDMLTASSHKINGPKAGGFLYMREGTQVAALQYGGEQERKRRPGTENVSGIKGFQRAVELAVEKRAERRQEYGVFKQIFLQKLKQENVRFIINGIETETVPAIVNISFPGTNVEALLTNFDLSGVAASSGSACTAGSIEPSHVLSAMFGKGDDRTTNSIRFSFGLANTKENAEEAAERVASIVKRLAQ
ncbi:cysteine desulfurase family protein [Sediminibacillus halophilus]|uniref:Cysteine desulfurase n=1 Tax=Sediminibacillus halophilus TaxID=482461 RepID=A0A1G9XTX7_9BACI|nr:cysteine desulfurase family protein [Sediminibacillus halophilus]SDM99941.1 cysteine desulfurase [Sediminibacillus halophilus]